MRAPLLPLVLLIALPTAAQPDAPALTDTPSWARRAIWYQIFPERFRNGDPSNDPTPASIWGSWPHVPTTRLEEVGWRPTPWTHDWYAQEDWAHRLGEPFYYTVQLRRYGGDLQGVLEKLEYLDSLGVTALYFNPLNDAPSLHKYDARNYHHIDVHFGPDPAGDAAIIASENPADPSTWRWTSADSLFLRVVRAAHAYGLRVVMDYSWNHTGLTFWAFRDAIARGHASPYAGWYYIRSFDDPATPDTSELAYEGWAGVRELPELMKVNETGNPHEGIPYDGNVLPAVRDHVYAVTRRWLDPNNDGDPSDGVDGFRLDVAEQVPLGFWRDYRRFVKGINPEAALIGEIWWQQWPRVMSDIRPYLGDVFDGVMHYRWYRPARSLVVGSPPAETPTSFARHLDSLYAGTAPANLQALMSTAGTHDAPRLSTELFNPEVPYKTDATPRARPDYRAGRPDEAARRAQRLVLLLQFTLPGAPHLFYGDEVGMWGADDPDNRKPMIWDDLAYAPEATEPNGAPRATPDLVSVDHGLLAFYHDLIALRHEHVDLFSAGTLDWLVTDDAGGVLAYRRALGGQEAVVVLNLSDAERTVRTAAAQRFGWATGPGVVGSDYPGSFDLPPRTGAVFFR
ncbi:MAG TPA: glycoside hydrolase family 13 protein [Rubricoccaceae bacterium]|nr:glycoside hydrolase family 13 protein [Rubricoccaceae bacterium]